MNLWMILSVVLLLLVAIVLILHLFPVIPWLTIHTGSSNVAGVAQNYNFWSGFGSDLGEYTIVASVLAGVYHTARKHNCATHGCWRIGSLPVGDYRVCKKHHLEVTGVKVDVDHLKKHHLLRNTNPAG